MPSFTDFDQKSELRSALAAYDAGLQAELLAHWNTEILGRSGLSTVVFEQKLTTANQTTPSILVLPADTLVLCVLDLQRKELRVHLNAVRKDMQAANAKTFKIEDTKHLAEKLPAEVARYIADSLKLTPAATAAPQAEPAERLTCAMLEPVSAEGANHDLAKISPLIRATLESTLAGQDSLELVERSEAENLLEEKMLADTWSPASASSLGKLVKADLVLVPFIYFQDQKSIHTYLFVLDVSSGRLLACRSWSSAPLDSPPADQVADVIRAGVTAAQEARKAPVADNSSQRYAEAEFLLTVSDSWLGLRQSVATESELSLRLLDAGLALSHDNPALMTRLVGGLGMKALPSPNHPLSYQYLPHEEWLAQLKELERSGQLALIRSHARAVLEIPLRELAKSGEDWNKRQLATYYLGQGEPQRALEAVTAGKPLSEVAQNDVLYERVAQILMYQQHYQECIDFVKSRKTWSRPCTQYLADAYRAMGNNKEEFMILFNNPASAGSSKDRIVRLLDLGRELGYAKPTLGRMVQTASPWQLTDPIVVGSFIRARLAAGQTELAASEAQCAHILARKNRDDALLKDSEALLNELKVTPIDHLGTPAEVISWPKDYRIRLIYDQTIKPDDASAAAQHLATFWGCTVELRRINFDATKTPYYDGIAQSLDGPAFARALLLTPPLESSLGNVFLTHTKLISRYRNTVGDIYAAPAGDVEVLSDHYFEKFRSSDPRELPLVTAIAAASLPSIKGILANDCYDQNDWSKSFSPLPPDVFTANGTLAVPHIDLGIAPFTASLLKKRNPEEWIRQIANYRASELSEVRKNSAGADATVRELNEQIARATPTLVLPSSKLQPTR